VNTPESVHPDEKQNIPMGKVASRYTQKKLIGRYINLEFEIKKLRGNYGRLLAYVFVDGQNLNLDLVRQGYLLITLNMERVRNMMLNFALLRNLPEKRN
jgi:micrococcal nuclease